MIKKKKKMKRVLNEKLKERRIKENGSCIDLQGYEERERKKKKKNRKEIKRKKKRKS